MHSVPLRCAVGRRPNRQVWATATQVSALQFAGSAMLAGDLGTVKPAVVWWSSTSQAMRGGHGHEVTQAMWLTRNSARTRVTFRRTTVPRSAGWQPILFGTKFA